MFTAILAASFFFPMVESGEPCATLAPSAVNAPPEVQRATA